MNDIQKIKEFFSKSMEEAMDFNDPVLMKARAAKFQRSQPKPEPPKPPKPSKAEKNADKIKDLERERAQLMRDMNQVAKKEGGEIADEYGDLLNKIDKAIAKLKGQPMMEEAITTAYEGKNFSIKNYKVGDIVGNTVQGFNFKVLAINGDKLEVEDTRTGKKITTHTDNMYLSTVKEAKSSIKVGDIVQKSYASTDEDYIKEFEVVSIDKNGKATLKDTKTGKLTGIYVNDLHKVSMNEAKSEDPVDTITMDIPLFLRMLEYSREDASQDMDLHDVTEKANKLGKEKGILSMEDYEEIVGAAEEVKEGKLNEVYIPSNVKAFAERKGVLDFVEEVAGWAERVGARVTGGTAIGKDYNTIILDLGYQTADIYIDTENGTVELYGEPVRSFSDFKDVFMDQMTKDEMEKDENQFRREQGLEERIAEALNKINEELCPAGKAYIKKRKAAGEKSSAYLSGRAVKVCKGQMSGKSKKKK